MKTYFAGYNDYFIDCENGDSAMGHLLAFNTGEQDCPCRLTFLFEDREPEVIEWIAVKQRTNETNWERWNFLNPPQRFAFFIDTPQPLTCQITIGQNNSSNNYSSKAKGYPEQVRETVLSYFAGEPAREMQVADGILLNQPSSIWVRETESLFLANPHKQAIDVAGEAYLADRKLPCRWTVPAQRLRVVDMADHVPNVTNYGLKICAPKPIGAQWLRRIFWYDRPQLMSAWSLPLQVSKR